MPSAINVNIEINLGGLVQNVEGLANAIESGTHPAIQAAWEQVGLRYLSFIRQRFDRASHGDGTWQELAYATKLQRARALRGPGYTKRDEPLTIKQRETERRKKFDRMVRLYFRSGGYEGAGTVQAIRAKLIAGMHFDILRDTGTLFNSISKGGKGNIFTPIPNGITLGTAIKYAEHHQNGGPHLPRRAIFVEPTEEVGQQMRERLQIGVNRVAQQMIGQQNSGTMDIDNGGE